MLADGVQEIAAGEVRGWGEEDEERAGAGKAPQVRQAAPQQRPRLRHGQRLIVKSGQQVQDDQGGGGGRAASQRIQYLVGGENTAQVEALADGRYLGGVLAEVLDQGIGLEAVAGVQNMDRAAQDQPG